MPEPPPKGAIAGPLPDRKIRRYHLASLGVFLLGMSFSFFIWQVTRQAAHTAEKERIVHYGEMMRTMLAERINMHIATLRGMKAFWDGSYQVTREEWQRYVATLGLEHYQGALGFAFVRRVWRQDLQTFLAETRADNSLGFTLTTSGESQALFVVEFIEPLEKNRQALGYDIGQEEVRRQAATASVELNREIISGRIALVQDENQSSSVLLMIPVYQKNLPINSTEERWRALRGWVDTPMRMDDLTAHILDQFGIPLRLVIEDLNAAPGKSLLFTGDSPSDKPNKFNLQQQFLLDIAGRQWLLRVSTNSGFLPHDQSLILLLAGILLSLLAAWQVSSYGRPLKQALQLADAMTRELRQSEERFHNMFLNHNAAMLLISVKDGVIIDANEAASRFYGYSPERLRAMTVYDINPLSKTELGNIIKRIANCEIKVMELQHQLASGAIRDVEVHSSPIVVNQQTVLFSIIHDVTPQKLAQRALAESEERFRLAFDTKPDPVILALLEDGIIIDVNKAFESATGISRIEAIGHNSEDLGLWVDPGQRDIFREHVQRDGEINNLEADFHVVGGLVKTGLLSARMLTISQKLCMLVVIRDITAEKAVERALVEMDRIKNEFISTAAHELRTPLTAMMGFTELLCSPAEFGGFDMEQQKDFLDEIYERGEALSRIIDDLLDISRIESGRPIALDLEETNLCSLLKKTLDFYQVHDPEHQFRLEKNDIPDSTTVLIDRQRVNQVLENLMSNAGKYSAKGTEIVLTGRRLPEGWEISVEDHGIGMTPHQVEKVFDKFYRVDSSNTAVGGLGLGMSIAKQIVEAHGGNIKVDSQLGKGTKVSFFLPG